MADITELYPELNYFQNFKRYFEIRNNKVEKDTEFIATCEERRDYDKTNTTSEK